MKGIRTAQTLAVIAALTAYSCASPGQPKFAGPSVGSSAGFNYSVLHHDEHNRGQANDDHGKGYAYGRKEKIGDFTVETVEVDDVPVRFLENQVIINLPNEAQLPRLLQKYHATLIERVTVPDGPVIDIGGDRDKTSDDPDIAGGPHQVVHPEEKSTNIYKLELLPTEGDNVEDLSANGQKAGFRGKWNFFSAEAAFLCAKVARMATDEEFQLDSISLKFIYSSNTATTIAGSSTSRPL